MAKIFFNSLIGLTIMISGYLWANGNSKMIIIDVRKKAEWDSGHLQTAIHMPLDAFDAGIELLVKDKKQPVYLYCRSGNRSGKALELMNALDYTNVINAGGIGDASRLLKVKIIK
jgi:phage shock protein E